MITNFPLKLLLAMYFWMQGLPPQLIVYEVKLDENTVTQLNAYWRQALRVLNAPEPPLGLPRRIVEVDETALDKRKFRRRKTAGKTGTICFQTAVEVSVDAAGGRKSVRAKAVHTESRTREDMVTNCLACYLQWPTCSQTAINHAHV